MMNKKLMICIFSFWKYVNTMKILPYILFYESVKKSDISEINKYCTVVKVK